MLTWDELEDLCNKCTRCDLSQTRTNLVFGVGPRDADVMFVGEGPGEQEDLKGEPFVGAAGKLLDDMLSIIDLSREKCYIIKCRPPHNRDPQNAEQEACIGYLYKQIALIRPKIIVCLGRIAAQKVINPDFKITRDHGKWIESQGVFLTAIYHPAALLRDPSKRPDTFADLLEIRNKIRQIGAKI